jgi:hypothetical protein
MTNSGDVSRGRLSLAWGQLSDRQLVQGKATTMPATLRARAGAALVATLLGLGGIAIGTGPTAGAATKNCGDIEPVTYGLKADGVSCAEAKKLTKKWLDKALYDEAFIHDVVKVSGYRCKYSFETSKVRCADGGKSVKWLAALI